MKKSILLAAAALLCLAACKDNKTPQGPEPPKGERFTATLETLTKTSVQEGQLRWEEGDSVSIFDADGKHFKFIASKSGAETELIQSEETPDDLNLEGAIYAVYPYCDTTEFDHGDVVITMPTTRQFASNSLSSTKASIMTAMTVDKTLAFKNLCSYLEVDLAENTNITDAYVYAGFTEGEEHAIAGKVKVEITSEGTPTVREILEADGINIFSANESGIIPAGKYYIPVLPGNYNNIRAKLNYAAEDINETVNASDIFKLGPFAAERNKVVYIGEVYDTRDWFKWLTFEDGNFPEYNISSDHAGTFDIVSNPCSCEMNSSAKCLAQEITSKSSGYFTIAPMPKGATPWKINSSTLKRCLGIKLNIYIGGNDDLKFYPRLKFSAGTAYLPARINGQAPAGADWTQDELDAVYNWDSWNEVEFYASQKALENLETVDGYLFRPTVAFDDTNMTPGASGSMVVYYDNIGYTFRALE